MRLLIVRLAIVCLWAGLALHEPDLAAQTQSARGQSITNADVIKMVQSGVSEEIILSALRGAKDPQFDVSPSGLIGLKKAGVPDRVVAAMQQSARGSQPSGERSASSISPTATGLSREAAAKTIRAHELFNETLNAVVVPGRRCIEEETAAQYYRRMQVEFLDPVMKSDQRWQLAAQQALGPLGLTITQVSPARPQECKTNRATVEETALTMLGRKQSAGWRTAGAGWFVPISRRELVSVDGVRQQTNSADVDFSWKWLPLQGDEVPASIEFPYKGRAVFERYDDGWRLEESLFRVNFYSSFDGMKANTWIFGVARKANAATAGASTAGSSISETLTPIPSAAPETLETAEESLRNRAFADAATTAMRLLDKSPNDARALRVVGQSLYESRNFVEGLSPLKEALRQGQPVEITVKHHHTSRGLMLNDEFCIGTLKLGAGMIEFSSSRAGDAFRVAAQKVVEVRNETQRAGRVRVRVRIPTDTRENERTYNFHSIEAVTRTTSPNNPAPSYVMSCDGCEASTRVIYELLELARTPPF